MAEFDLDQDKLTRPPSSNLKKHQQTPIDAQKPSF